MFFDAGAFRDLTELARNEVALPIEDPYGLERRQWCCCWGTTKNRPVRKTNGKSAGFIQVRNGLFEAQLVQLNSNLIDSNYRPVYLTQKGVPHGFGINVDKKREEAANNPAVAARFSAHSGAELLRLLNEASKQPNSGVGRPFSLMLLKADGSLEDHSDNQVCENEHGLPML